MLLKESVDRGEEGLGVVEISQVVRTLDEFVLSPGNTVGDEAGKSVRDRLEFTAQNQGGRAHPGEAWPSSKVRADAVRDEGGLE